MRKLWIGLTAVIVLVVAGLAGGSLYLRSALPAYDGEARVVGLEAPVEIWRDSLGVPHLWAESVHDLAFAQGYVHAQERLWQMELFRRVAEGRLAEILGPELVGTDRFLRTIGLWRTAGRNEARLDPEIREVHEAYAAGVNAWIRGHDGALPPEFVVLGVEPEPWTVRHSLAIEQIMAWDLAEYEIGLAVTRAVRRLGAERARHLMPGYPEWGATILEAPIPPEVPAEAAALLDALSITRASNSWVVGGSRTRSGKPILANDMHLALQAPSLWYLMALHAGGEAGEDGDLLDRRYDVVGMTLPGTAFVVAGHNRAVAWGFTNAMVDDADFFIERLDPADSTRYLTPEGSEPFRVVQETIQVNGLDEPVVHTVRFTRHGPVLTPVESRVGDAVVAFRWTAHDPSGTSWALVQLNAATNWDEFVGAVEQFDNPHQNVIYADTAGNIGYWMGGRVPIRGDGKRPPLVPVPGWTGEWDWTGELPFEKHPHVLNPPEDYIVTANNRQTAGAVADRINRRWAPPFRALRIGEMIRAAGPGTLDAAAVHRQQMDVRDALAERYLDRAVAAAEAVGLAEAADRLRAWNLEARRDSRAAALFYVWHERLRRGAARELYGGDGGWVPNDAVNTLLERRALPWVDPKEGGAAFRSLAARAMQEADSVVGEGTWGELHRVAAAHSFDDAGRIGALLDGVFGFNVGPEPGDGSPYTVNVSHYRGEFPVRSSYGASQRHVVDMGDVDGAGGFILPTGQSGLPFSEHYRDQWDRYRNGVLWRIPLDRAGARARTVHEFVLRPVDDSE